MSAVSCILQRRFSAGNPKLFGDTDSTFSEAVSLQAVLTPLPQPFSKFSFLAGSTHFCMFYIPHRAKLRVLKGIAISINCPTLKESSIWAIPVNDGNFPDCIKKGSSFPDFLSQFLKYVYIHICMHICLNIRE